MNTTATVANLENEAQMRIKRIGELRAQISNLKRDEEKVQSEFNDVRVRIAAHRKRREELSQLKEEEASLSRDIKQREEKQSTLITELERLQEMRRQLTSQIALLRSRVTDEEAEAEKDKEELKRLERILADNEARTKTILDDTEFLNNADEELATLEKKYQEIVESIPLARKKYEETKRLVDEMEKNVNPVSQIIMDIWKKLPPDVLDRLILPQMPRKD
jgi:chromosome segregation ATPase